jgi:hypothetical protein
MQTAPSQRRRPPVLALLFLAGVVISGFTMLNGIDPFDEGISLQAAHRVSEGQAPYADFLWSYGPAWPYLLAGLFKAFGVSLLQWRVLRVMADAAVALVVFVLLRRWVGSRRALVGWLAAACAMAEPRSANPFPYALLAALLALLVATGGPPTRGRLIGAAALTAAAAAFRLDFALYGAAGVAVVLVLDGGRARGRLRLAGGYLAAAAGMSLLVYLPFLIDVGPSRLYDALAGTSLRERGYWTLPFPLSYDGRLRGWPPGSLAHDLKDVVDFYQPLLLAIGSALALVAVVLRRRAAAAWAGLGVFALGGLSYLLSRTDEFHTQPLFVALCALLPAVVAFAWRGPRLLAAAAACVFVLMLAHGVANRVSALFRPPAMSRVHVATADGVEAPPREARALEQVVADVHARVPPGQPIYVAPRRPDLLGFSNSIVYVLAERDNAARRDYGLLASAAAQQAIVAELSVARPRVVVRWTDPLSSKAEPNKRGRPTGVHTLDRYLAARYRLLHRLYHYDVLVPR